MATPAPFPITQTSNTITIIYEGESYSVTEGQVNYEKLRTAIFHREWDKVPDYLSTEKTLEDWAEGLFTVRDGKVVYDGYTIPDAVQRRILGAVASGEDPTRYMRFWERLDRNPNHNSVQQLLNFLGHAGIPINSDGMIIAYKGVRQNFRDCHSGKFDNSPGKTLRMKRWRVSPDPKTPCHFGLHVGAREYAAVFGKRVVIVEVDPENVVSVPDDHSCQKMRVCEYRVIGLDNGSLLPDYNFDEVAPVDDDQLPTPAVVEDSVVEVNDEDYDDEPEEWDDEDYDEDEMEDEPFDVLDVEEEPTPVEPAVHPNGQPVLEGETAPTPANEAGMALPKTGTEWDYLNDYDSVQMMKVSLTHLRRYARNNCLVVGASKMPGGKVALIPAIIKARGYNDPSDRS